MTDTKLRELERRFKESGSLQDEVAWLRARVQAGDVSTDSLELAAYVGYEPARVAAAEGVLPRVLERLDDNFHESFKPDAGAYEGDEPYLGVSQSFSQCDDVYAEIDAAEAAYFEKLKVLQESLSEVFGPAELIEVTACGVGTRPPKLGERLWTEGFVKAVARWHLCGDRVLLLGIRHQDKELPLELVGSIRVAGAQ